MDPSPPSTALIKTRLSEQPQKKTSASNCVTIFDNEIRTRVWNVCQEIEGRKSVGVIRFEYVKCWDGPMNDVKFTCQITQLPTDQMTKWEIGSLGNLVIGSFDK